MDARLGGCHYPIGGVDRFADVKHSDPGRFEVCALRSVGACCAYDLFLQFSGQRNIFEFRVRIVGNIQYGNGITG